MYILKAIFVEDPSLRHPCLRLRKRRHRRTLSPVEESDHWLQVSVWYNETVRMCKCVFDLTYLTAPVWIWMVKCIYVHPTFWKSRSRVAFLHEKVPNGGRRRDVSRKPDGHANHSYRIEFILATSRFVLHPVRAHNRRLSLKLES